MTSAFVLLHVHEVDGGDEQVKFIGLYSSRQKAQEAVARLTMQPGFATAPDGFHIDEYQLDQDHWTEGYISVAEANEAPARSPSVRG